MALYPETTAYINGEKLDKALERIAGEINRDYKDKNPLVIGVLVGSFIFLADLVRKLNMPLDIEFVRLCSYGSGTESSGDVRMVLEPRASVKGRDILVVEDIIDTGYSLSFLLKYLENLQPASVKLCVLMDKPSRRKVDVKIDYVGFTVPDEFLVGYGLDCNSKYRNIPEICLLSDTKSEPK